MSAETSRITSAEHLPQLDPTQYPWPFSEDLVLTRNKRFHATTLPSEISHREKFKAEILLALMTAAAWQGNKWSAVTQEDFFRALTDIDPVAIATSDVVTASIGKVMRHLMERSQLRIVHLKRKPEDKKENVYLYPSSEYASEAKALNCKMIPLELHNSNSTR